MIRYSAFIVLAFLSTLAATPAAEPLLTRAGTLQDMTEYRLDVVQTADNTADVHIYCSWNCNSEFHFHDRVTDRIVAALTPYETSPDIITIWAAGQGYRVRVYRLNGPRAAKVMDQPSQTYPQLLLGDDNSIQIAIHNPASTDPERREVVTGQLWRSGPGPYRPITAKAHHKNYEADQLQTHVTQPAESSEETIAVRAISHIDGQTYQLDSIEYSGKDPAEGLMNRQIHIRCIANCRRTTPYSDDIMGGVTAAFPAFDGSRDFIVITTTGSAYWINVYRIGPTSITKVMEHGSKYYPTVITDTDGQTDIILDTPDDSYPRQKRSIIGQIWRSTPQGYVPVTNKKGGH